MIAPWSYTPYIYEKTKALFYWLIIKQTFIIAWNTSSHTDSPKLDYQKDYFLENMLPLKTFSSTE